MKAKDKIKHIATTPGLTGEEQAVAEKIDELIELLAATHLEGETAKLFQQRIDEAFENKKEGAHVINAFKVIDTKDAASREELLEEFSMLLQSNKIDSRIAGRYLKSNRASKVVLMLIGIILTTLGLAMIIMPAPPYFEMFTIYYFNRDDGVTLMDLISLGIVFSGIYLFVRSLYKKSTV